jgi:hypothetical protein
MRNEALGFVDHVRRNGDAADINNERYSLGHPGIYNNVLKRKIDWTPNNFEPERVTYEEISHVWPGDVYVSTVDNGIGPDYRGQTFICYPTGDSDEIDAPQTMGAYVMYDRDDPPF